MKIDSGPVSASFSSPSLLSLLPVDLPPLAWLVLEYHTDEVRKESGKEECFCIVCGVHITAEQYIYKKYNLFVKASIQPATILSKLIAKALVGCVLLSSENENRESP